MKTFIEEKLTEIHREMINGSLSGNTTKMFDKFEKLRAEIIESIGAAETMIDGFAELNHES